MMILKWLLCLLIVLTMTVNAGQRNASFKCDDAEIVINADDRSEYDSEEFNEVNILVKKGTSSLKIKEENDWFKIACLKDKDNKLFLVYQSVCGGSACRDLDNYGIIDINNLQSVLSPSDENREAAARLLGTTSEQLYQALNDNQLFPNTPKNNTTNSSINNSEDLIKLIIAASIEGNENNVLEVKHQIESKPSPEHGNRKTARKLNDDALLLLKGNDFQTAAEVLSSAMNADNSDAEIASNLCYALIKAGKPNDAEQPCRRSLMLKPNRAAAWANLAEVYADKGDLKSTIALLDITYLLSTDKNKTKEFFQKYFIDEQKSKILITSANQALQNEGIKPVSENTFSQQKTIVSSNDIKSVRTTINKQENTQASFEEVKKPESNDSSIILIIENKFKSISDINDNIVYGIVIIILIIFAVIPFFRLASSIIEVNKNKYTELRNVRISEYAEPHKINNNEVSDTNEESTDFNNEKSINKTANQIKQPIEKNISESFSYYLKAAETGDAVAQYRLGQLYEDGTEEIEPSDEDAVVWYRKAAEQGLAEAQYELGLNYEDGIGVEQDKEIAANWYRKAAEQGLSDAQYQLGACFVDGIGVKQDNKKAVYWFKKAADQGFADAQYELGICCEKGIGIEKDREMAVYWLTKAAKQGHSEANNSNLIKWNLILNKALKSNIKFTLTFSIVTITILWLLFGGGNVNDSTIEKKSSIDTVAPKVNDRPVSEIIQGKWTCNISEADTVTNSAYEFANGFMSISERPTETNPINIVSGPIRISGKTFVWEITQQRLISNDQEFIQKNGVYTMRTLSNGLTTTGTVDHQFIVDGIFIEVSNNKLVFETKKREKNRSSFTNTCYRN